VFYQVNVFFSFFGHWIGTNLPSAPKAQHKASRDKGLSISYFLLSYARFVVTNKVIFVGNLSAKY